MKKSWPYLFLLFILASLPVQAKEGLPKREMLIFEDVSRVITASRYLQPISEAPASIDVINESEIKRMGARTLSDVLRRIAGVYVSASERHLEKIYIRGIGTVSSYNDKVLLLIDGTPQRELFYGHAFIDEYLPVENIKRIELIRGPGSALYGTNAFGGVINVITKDAEDIEGTQVSAGWGSVETKSYSIIHAQVRTSSKIMIFARRYETEGDGQEFSKKYKRNVLQQDPARASSFGLKYSLGDLSLDAKYLEFRHKFPTNWDFHQDVWNRNWFHYKNLFLDLKYETKLSEKVTGLAKVWWQHYDNPSFFQKYDSDITTFTVITADIWPLKESQILSIQTQFSFILPFQQRIILGAQYDYEEIIEAKDLEIKTKTGKIVDPPPFWMSPMDRENFAFYLQDIWKVGNWLDVTLGLRSDWHQVFGQSINPRFAAVLRPDKRTAIKLLYGQAFRVPSYRELYTRTGEWTEGNENLKPEKIKSPEIEIDYRLTKNIKTRLNYYQSYITNLITTKEVEPGREGYVNLAGKTIARGLEYLLRFTYEKGDVSLNYSLSDIRDETDKRLHSIPMHMANLSGSYQLFEDLHINSDLFWVGKRKRWSDDTNQYDLRYPKGQRRPDVPAYTTVNLTLISKVKDIEVSLSIYNLFDEKQYDPHEEPKYFDIELPGRNFRINTIYRF